MLDVLCAGETAWDLSTGDGLAFEDARSLAFEPGGGALNVARHLAGMGVSVGLSTGVGRDALGDALLLRLTRLGVATTDVVRTKEPTDLVFLERRPSPQRRVVPRRGEARFGLLATDARVLVLSGLRPDAASIRTLTSAIRRHRQNGALVVLDVNARRSLWRPQKKGDLERASALLLEVDLLRASREDADAMGTELAVLGRTLEKSGVPHVLTEGMEGIVSSFPNGGGRWSPTELVETASASGAGDAFTASFVAALARSGTLDVSPRVWDAWLHEAHSFVCKVLSTAQ